ncbi:MAG TPA: dTDP-4-amino-4,6-dideoxygalactose transaminase [Vicinamibacteria bacterium]|nr:dTDP-4-amino-4,6-dideoxygalactose transaminase [Vicinamibacteria bacterium]
MAPATPIPLSRPSYDEREIARIREALRGRTAGDGPFGQRVERRLEALLGVRRVLLTTSCTHALELALMALGLTEGQQVVVPSFTFVSTANAVLRAGARLVLADIEEETLGLDPSDVERRLTDRTTALLPVHYAGIAARMDELLAIARRRGLKVVEDAAQGIGASWRGRPLGSLGDAGCLSFHDTKNLSCGEGGALALHDEEASRRAEIIREKGTNRSAFLRGEVDKYTWVAEGSSYILSDVLAAILDAQLDKQAEIASRRAAIAARYREGLSRWASDSGVRLCPEPQDRALNHHIFYMLLPDPASQARCIASLKANGIGAAFHYVPLHSSPFGRALGLDGTDFPVSAKVAATLVRLPIHAEMGDADVERVLDAVVQSLE